MKVDIFKNDFEINCNNLRRELKWITKNQAGRRSKKERKMERRKAEKEKTERRR